jgi:hypothetical protein
MQLARDPNRVWTVRALHAQIRAEFPTARDYDVEKALKWNQSRGFVDYQYNAEFETDEWSLTDRGRAAH